MSADTPRILLVTGRTPPLHCGVGDYTAHLARALAQHGLHVGVIAGVGSGGIDGVDVQAIMPSWRWRESRRLFAAIEAWRPDVVHFQYPAQDFGRHRLPWIMALITSLRGKHVAQTWHEHYRQRTWIDLKGSLLNLANALTPGPVVAVRPGYREQLSPWYRRLMRDERLHLIPNAATIPATELTPDERALVRADYGVGDRRLMAYFGFAIPTKGVERLFEICNPATDHLLLLCTLNAADPYQARLLKLAQSPPWLGHATVAGFLPAADVGRALAAADAIVLPFREGGGPWNTSLQAARLQPTFVLTTARPAAGYDVADHTFTADPADLESMRRALRTYADRRPTTTRIGLATWDAIANAHIALYRAQLGP